MSKEKPHGYTREDAVGYYCGTCGLDLYAPEEQMGDCPGPQPLLDYYYLQVAEACLRNPAAYNEHSRLVAADKIKAHIEWQGCRWRKHPPFPDLDSWNGLLTEVRDTLEAKYKKQA
jgi:hypothetical protein